MKIRKTMTEKAVAANRRNAGELTGPKTEQGKRASRINPRYVRQLGRTLNFDEDEEDLYPEFLDTLLKDYRPSNMVQTLLVKEVADSTWKLSQTAGWEAEAVRSRSATSPRSAEGIGNRQQREL